jgi:hypothetical protein
MQVLGTTKLISGFDPRSVGSCQLWLDAADTGTMNSTSTVTQWNDKSGSNNNFVGTATYSGGTMTFNGTTQAFSNTSYVFPSSTFSIYAVYSNTTAPASTSYMNALYGNGGYPMLGVYGNSKNVSARAVVANTGFTTSTVGWAAALTTATGSAYGRAVATDPTGNVFVGGSFGTGALTSSNATTVGGSYSSVPFGTGTLNGYIAKYSSTGTVLWVTSINSVNGAVTIYGAATDSSGNVYITGTHTAALTIYNVGGTTGATLTFVGGNDCFLIKYSPTGTVLWAALMTGTTTSSDVAYAVATDPSGNVFVTGNYTAAFTLYNSDTTTGATLALTGGGDVFFAKYSSTGNVLWAARLASSGNDVAAGITTDTNGNMFATGYFSAAATVYNANGTTGTSLAFVGGIDVYLVKYSSTGTVTWGATMTGATTSSDNGNGVATDSSGNVYVVGGYTTAITFYHAGGSVASSMVAIGLGDGFLAKYTSAGLYQWSGRWGSSTTADYASGVAVDLNGEIIVTGYCGGVGNIISGTGVNGPSIPSSGGNDAFIAKYTSTGAAVSWVSRIGSAGSDFTNGPPATDIYGNIYFLAFCSAAPTVYISDQTAAVAFTLTGTNMTVLAKYSGVGTFLGGTPATSNTVVCGINSWSVYVNGTTQTAITGTVAATTGVYVGGPLNYFNGSISEILIYNSTLNTNQRTLVEGYLAWKWQANSRLPITHPLYSSPATTRRFSPLDLPGCTLWLDASDPSTMNSTTTVTQWLDKSGLSNHALGSGTLSGGRMTFNGTTEWFSNASLYYTTNSMIFMVYSNTTPPAAGTPMIAFSISNSPGKPWFGVYGNTALAMVSISNVAAALSGNIPVTSNVIVARQVSNVYVNGTLQTALVNNNETATGSFGYMLSGTPYTGRSDPIWNGSISEIIMYSYTTSLSDAQRQAVEWYLADKWNLRSQLVSSHPYKIYPALSRASGITQPSSVTFSPNVDSAGNILGATISWVAPDTYVDGFVCVISSNSNSTSGVYSGYISGSNTSNFTFTQRFLGSTMPLYASVYAYSSLNGTSAITSSTGVRVPWGLTSWPTPLSVASNDFSFLAAYSLSGNPLWITRGATDGSPSPGGPPICTDFQGNIYVVMTTGRIYNRSMSAPFNLTGNAGTRPTGICTFTNDGNVFASYSVASFSSNTNVPVDTPRGHAIQCDSSGNVYTLSTNYGQYQAGGESITIRSISSILYFTTSQSSYQYGDLMLIKYDRYTNAKWVVGINILNSRKQGCMAVDPSGNIYVGEVIGGVSGKLWKYTTSGALIWSAVIAGTSNLEGVTGVTTDSSGNAYIVGMYKSTVSFSNGTSGVGVTLTNPTPTLIQGFIAMYSSTGVSQWAARFYSPVTNFVYTNSSYSSIVCDSNSNLYVCGFYSNTDLTLQNANGTTGATLTGAGATNYYHFVCSYTSTGNVRWATRFIANYYRPSISIDSNSTIWVTGQIQCLSNTILSNGDSSASSYSLPLSARLGIGSNMYLVSYTSNGNVASATVLRPDGCYSAETSIGSFVSVYNNTVYVTGKFSCCNVIYPTSNNYNFPGLAAGGTVTPTRKGIIRYSSYGNTSSFFLPTDSNIFSAGCDGFGNLYFLGQHTSAITLYNADGSSAATVPWSGTTSYNHLYVVKYDSNCLFQWYYRIASAIHNETAIDKLVVDSNGNTYVALQVSGTGAIASNIVFYNSDGTVTLANTFSSLYVVKYNSNGFAQWRVPISSITSIAADNSGNLFIGGSYPTSVNICNVNNSSFASIAVVAGGTASTNDSMVVKFNSNGVGQWVSKIATNNNVTIGAIGCDSNGNVFVGGHSDCASPSCNIDFYNIDQTTIGRSQLRGYAGGQTGFFEGFLVKYSSAGTILWGNRVYCSTGSTSGLPVASESVITRYLKIDSAGNVLWGTTVGAAGTLTVYSYNLNAYGTATTFTPVNTLAGATSIYIFKVRNDGSYVASGVVASGTYSVSPTNIITGPTGDFYTYGQVVAAGAGVSAFSTGGASSNALYGSNYWITRTHGYGAATAGYITASWSIRNSSNTLLTPLVVDLSGNLYVQVQAGTYINAS